MIFLISSPGFAKSRTQTVKSSFQQNFTPTHHKIRRTSNNLLDIVNTELQKLINEQQIVKPNRDRLSGIQN